MSARRRLERKTDERRPVVTDDYIYDDPVLPGNDGEDSEPVSDTPEEAIRKLKKRRTSADSAVSAGDEPAAGEAPSEKKETSDGSFFASSGIALDENLMPVSSGKKPRKRHPLLRGIALFLVTFVLLVVLVACIFHRIYPDTAVLGIPENTISSVVSPVQDFFSGLTEAVFGYFRTMKLRANIYEEYNKIRDENEQLTYKVMLVDELQNELNQFRDIDEEMALNEDMHPIRCRITGRSDNNYFSTFTINRGSKHGIQTHMAVTINGGLVGYTETVEESSSTVRTIIDSSASIAAVIDSSRRDHGTVRGTLGIDGTSTCRMYYLPDDALPRPGDTVVTSGVGFPFPKGIPIGIIRESTRGMDANKQYIVVEPKVDFLHLEYVIVLRYKPDPEPIEGRDSGRNIEFVELETARPYPPIPLIARSVSQSSTPVPEGFETPFLGPTDTPTPSPTPTPTPSPTPTVSPVPTPSPTPGPTSLTYRVVQRNNEPTPSPTPTAQPTATPYVTPDPDLMNYEED